VKVSPLATEALWEMTVRLKFSLLTETLVHTVRPSSSLWRRSKRPVDSGDVDSLLSEAESHFEMHATKKRSILSFITSDTRAF